MGSEGDCFTEVTRVAIEARVISNLWRGVFMGS